MDSNASRSRYRSWCSSLVFGCLYRIPCEIIETLVTLTSAVLAISMLYLDFFFLLPLMSPLMARLVLILPPLSVGCSLVIRDIWNKRQISAVGIGFDITDSDNKNRRHMINVLEEWVLSSDDSDDSISDCSSHFLNEGSGMGIAFSDGDNNDDDSSFSLSISVENKDPENIPIQEAALHEEILRIDSNMFIDKSGSDRSDFDLSNSENDDRWLS